MFEGSNRKSSRPSYNDGYTEQIPIINQNGATSFEVETLVDGPKAKWWHAAFHTVCAVVGAGVLGLPYSFSYLGWGPGVFLLTILTITSIYTSYLLAHLHEDGDRRLNTYREIGEAVWGRKWGWWAVAPVQYTLMIGLCITYMVTAGQSLKGMASSECDGPECQSGIAPWILLFAAAQLGLSQVPDFHSLWWVSLLGGAMSIGYCTISAGASIAVVAENPPPTYVREGQSSADYAFGVLNALGGIAFTFGGQAVLPEIQATLARPQDAAGTAWSMMRGIGVAYVVVILAYFSVAISGYAAFGATVHPDVLLSVSHPAALVNAANFMVVLHVAAGYQVFAMPLFDIGEGTVRRHMRHPPRPLVLRIVLRSSFVLVSAAVACMLPFFGDLMGLIASIGLMPVTFILPPLLWVSSRRPKGAELALNLGIAGVSIVIALLSGIGSMRNIIVDARNYHI